MISCDTIETIRATDLGRQIGYLRHQDEVALPEALIHTFDLSVEELP